MKIAFLLYTQDTEGRLNYFYTQNNITSRIFTVTQTHPEKDPVDEILHDLNIEIESERVTFLGTFNFDVIGPEEIDGLAINVSSIDMKSFADKWKLKSNPSHQLGREENSFLLGMFMKLLLEKTKIEMVRSK